jgi:putative SOS response-associated peptidase YedK
VAHRRDTSILQALLQPFPAQLMTAYPISKVNSVKNDTPAMIEPLRLGAQTKSSLL